MHTIEETREEKLARIERELLELEIENGELSALEVENGEPTETMPGNDLKRVLDLLNRLKIADAAASKTVLDRLSKMNFISDPPLLASEESTQTPSICVTSEFDQKMIQSIDDRLYKLERQIGRTLDQPPEPILPMLQILEHKLELALSDNNNNELDKRYKVNSLEQIEALYSSLPTIDRLTPLVSTVVQRLETLQQLHKANVTFAESEQDLEIAIESLQEDVNKWNSALDKLENSLEQDRVQAVQWFSEIDNRLQESGH